MSLLLIGTKLDTRLDHLEIKQDLVRYEREKPRPTVEMIQEAGDYLGSHRFTLANTTLH